MPRKLGSNINLLQSVAIGWKVRRIMRTKEILLRIQEIRDYERAAESATEERKRRDGGDKEHLIQLVSNLHHSRRVAIEKMINVIDKMS